MPCPLARSLITLALYTTCLEEVVKAAIASPAAIYTLSSSIVGATEIAKAVVCSPDASQEVIDVAFGHLEPDSAIKLLMDHSKGRRNASIYVRVSL